MHIKGVNLFLQQFEYRTLTLRRSTDTLLQDRLTDLRDLIRSEDGRAISQDLQNLIIRVLGEIESWLDRGEAAMTFETQITLSNVACNGPTKNDMQSIFMQGITNLSN